MANKKDDGRLKVKDKSTGEIFTFLQYIGENRVLAYDENGNFWVLNLYGLQVIV